MYQDMPGPSPVFPRYPRARTVQVPLELYPATQGSGGGLEALPAAQETVGEAPEPCTSERVRNGKSPLNCVGLKITENYYWTWNMLQNSILCIYFILCIILCEFVKRKWSHLGFFRCQHPVSHVGFQMRCQHPVCHVGLQV